jgi:histone H1/5
MGISDAIARVKQGVRQRTSELGEQLQSDAIPARLRPAAVRLAALLRVEPEKPGVAPESEAELPPVLDDALAAPSSITIPSIDPAIVAEAEEVAPADPAPADDKRAARRAAIARAATAATKSRPAPAPSVPSDSATRPKPTPPKPRAKKESAKGVAGKPGSANSSARRDAKSASKRTSAKAPRRK